MNKKLIVLLVLLCNAITAVTQNLKVEPPNWWAGHEMNTIQLMLYGDNISGKTVKFSGLAEVKLIKTHQVENPNYLFLDIEIAKNCEPGVLSISLGKKREKLSYDFKIQARNVSEDVHQGFSPSDMIYLLMPDRFANGDESNDDLGMKEGINREDNLGRHGGDLNGIIDHLDYFNQLGVTTLWLNPVQENNQPVESYHGYAITDFYKVDARFGTNELYKSLVDKSHDKGLKVIMDLVANHCGSEHWFIKNLPEADWIYQYDSFTRSNYRGVTNLDPYASEEDFVKMKKGWFDKTMPDLNQKNEHLATYLIQNSIWWIEYSGIDGIRMDTWSYPDEDFIRRWASEIKRIYPTFGIVGEVWENRSSTQAYWLEDANGNAVEDYTLTDFVWKEAVTRALTEDENWDQGLARIYYTLSEDRLYNSPNDLLTFLDNHDVARTMSVLSGDLDKMKMALVLLCTQRGTPQVYYGFELGYEGWSHGEVRPEFYGGWSDHSKNAVTGVGLTEKEKELQNFTKSLFNWRKSQGDFWTEASLYHYVPESGVYTYFRENAEKKIMVILNHSKDNQTVKMDRFKSALNGYGQLKNVLTQQNHSITDDIILGQNQFLVLELVK